jgi:RNA polymerase sigma-70 factor (ECF subfamily)
MVLSKESVQERFSREALPLHDVLFRQALHLVHKHDSAEDLVQETYLHAFKKFDSFTAGTNLRAWMARILFNHFVNQYRRNRKQGNSVELSVVAPFLGRADRAKSNAEAETPSELMRNNEFLNSLEGPLRRGLEDLDKRFRDALLLNAIGDASYAEIARELGIPVGTVMSRLHRAKLNLREGLAAANISSL